MSDYYDFQTAQDEPDEPPQPELYRYRRGYIRQYRLAAWHWRVGAAIIDFGGTGWLPAEALAFSQRVFGGPSDRLLVLVVAGLLWWNVCYTQGSTGQSLGKQLLGLQLARPVRTPDGDDYLALPGVIRATRRLLAHPVDLLVYPICVGAFRPLWHPKGQTFADSLTHTVVVRVPGLVELVDAPPRSQNLA